jgi:hypothetical protein
LVQDEVARACVDEPVDDELVASHYEATALVRSALEASLDTNKRG